MDILCFWFLYGFAQKRFTVCVAFLYFKINAIMRIQWLGNQIVLFHRDYKLQMKGPIKWKEFLF